MAAAGARPASIDMGELSPQRGVLFALARKLSLQLGDALYHIVAGATGGVNASSRKLLGEVAGLLLEL